VALLAWGTAELVKPVFAVSPFVLCLVYGVVATSIGFLERQPLRSANAFGFTILILMVFIFDGLKQATPQMLADLAWPLIATIGIGVLGMYVFSFVAGRLLGFTPAMAFACALTALYGFPADYIITNEVVNALSDEEEEREVLLAHMLPPMLVAGFITVTMVSVVLAGLFVGLL
jgi:signal transduction histidine kinase